MVNLLLLLIVILFSFAFFTLDEESLIILCSFLWLDAAGGLFKNLLDGELVHKVEVIRAKFVWYLSVKRLFLLDLLGAHTARLKLSLFVTTLNNHLLATLLTTLLSLFIETALLKRKYTAHLWVLNFGASVYHSKLVNKLDSSLSLFPFSSTLLVKTSMFSTPSVAYYNLFYPRAI